MKQMNHRFEHWYRLTHWTGPELVRRDDDRYEDEAVQAMYIAYEAAQQALEALERCVSTCFDQYAHEQVMSRPEHFVNQTITALRAALAEPVQEPVAKVELMTTGGNAGLATRIVEIDDHLRERLRPGQMLYTAPPQRKPLTDEEIEDLYFGKFSMGELNAFARAIERAHGIGGQDE